MKNTVIKYKREKIGEHHVRDYFSNTVKVRNIDEDFPELSKYFISATLPDNLTPESFTNAVYASPSLWDFFLLTNKREPLNGMPYDFDTLNELVNSRFEQFMEEHPRINITRERKEELYQQFMDEIDLRNEKNRIVNVVEPKNLSHVIQTLRQAKAI